MSGIEISKDRVAEHERAAWAERYMSLMSEYAQMRTVNEALQQQIAQLEENERNLTGRIRQMEDAAESPEDQLMVDDRPVETVYPQD